MSHETLNEDVELANLRLKLRGGIDVEFQTQGGVRCCVIQDPTSSHYYQVGIAEYALMSVLDGSRTLQQAIEATARRLGEDALSLRDALRIGHWLLEVGLAHSVDETGTPVSSPEPLLEKVDARNQQRVVARLNPLFLRWPLGSPEPIVKTATSLFGWMASFPFLFAWLVVVAYALVRVFQQSSELASSAQGLLTANAWLWMLATLVALKVVHELAHGVFCHRWGGRVKEAGVVFILLIPMPYVDVTSCWSFSDKWKRMAVSAAGMYIELFLAAVAAIVWSFSHDPVTKFHLFNVMLLGSLTTVLFNANFLMRFDGYYLLSDFVEVPNLYQQGQTFVHGLGRRYLLGMKGQANQQSSVGRRVLVGGYGVAALVWRILICVSLTLLATALLYGFGLALAIMAIVCWLGIPLFRMLSRWKDPTLDHRPNLGWVATVSMPMVLAVGSAVFWLPWPVQVSAPALIEYETPAVIRADAAGFVKAVNVTPGQCVQAGDVLVELENRELQCQLLELQLEREKSLIRSRSYHQDRQLASYQSENASRQALEQQIDELMAELSSLTVVAPVEGVVVCGSLESMLGQFVSSGQRLMQLVDERKKKIVISVSQDHLDTFESSQRAGIQFLPQFATTKTRGTLERVHPTATSMADIRLTTVVGGSLAVQQDALSSNEPSKTDVQKSKLIATRFMGEASVSELEAAGLRAGMTGRVRLNQYDRTIAETAIVSTRRWLQSLIPKPG